ncbi:tyrosine-type recombinase/integrase [Corynebacterium glyciniphilum]|uniref:tyrosine-type recombinase/integrase n=1 Tax=Corynebacterium glyciniphilum TaxID=1404244 RepID=UPI003A22C9F2
MCGEGQLRSALDRAGYEWVTSHTFRRTVATRLDDCGVSARLVADQLGHSQPSMTQDRYMGRDVVIVQALDLLPSH